MRNSDNHRWSNNLFYINMQKRSIKYLDFGLAVLLLLSVIYSLVQVFYDGIDYTDPYYFIVRYTSSGFLDSFHLLNQGIFALTHKLFGGYLITYKIVVWVFYALGMISCLWYGYNRTKNKRLLYLGTIVGLLCLPNATWGFAFNGNSMSILGAVLILIAMDSYTKGNKYALIWIGLLMAFLPLVRFPNIVIFIIALLISPFLCENWKEYGYVILSLSVGIVLYFLINFIVFGGISEFANSIKINFIESSDTTAADHSISHLFNKYLQSLKDGISYYKLLFPLAIVPLLGYFAKNKIYTWILAIISLIGLVVVIKQKVNPDSWFFSWFASCIFMMLCIIVCVFAVIRGDKKLFGWGLLPIGLGLGCCAGSTTGLTLFWAPICAMAPFILIKMDYILKSTNKNELIWAIISFLGIAVCSFLYCREDTMILGVIGLVLLITIVYFLSKKITFNIDKLVFNPDNAHIPLKTALATIIVCSSILFVASCWLDRGQRPLHTYVYPINEPKLKGIHTPQEQRIWIEDVMHEYRQLHDTQKNIIFYGFVSDLFPYLADIPSIKGVDFSWHENERNLQAFMNATGTNPIVFLCPSNPAGSTYNLNSYPKINEYLLSKGYTKELHEHYAIYYPQNVDKE